MLFLDIVIGSIMGMLIGSIMLFFGIVVPCLLVQCANSTISYFFTGFYISSVFILSVSLLIYLGNLYVHDKL